MTTYNVVYGNKVLYYANEGKYLSYDDGEDDSLLTFVTEASTDLFEAAFGIASGTLEWDMGDTSTSVSANYVSHKYAEEGNKIVKVYQGTTDGYDSFTGVVNLQDCNLVGSETIDLSGITNMDGVCWLDDNEAFTGAILFPGGATSNFNLTRNNMTGVADLRNLVVTGTNFYAYLCSNLTNIYFHATDNAFTGNFWLANDNITGPFDVSCLTGIGGSFQIHNNSNLSEIILPNALTQPFTEIDADDGSLSQASVDAIFTKLNVFFDASTPTTDLTVDVHGGTNMPPTDGESNSDIVSLTSIFSGAGHTFTANINT